MPIKFRFRWLPLVATVVAMAIGISAGQWQTRRAAEKEAIEAKLQSRSTAPAIDLNTVKMVPENLEFARVRVKGEFVREWPIFLDNRPYQGRPGFYLLMPMKLAGSNQAILIARGWIPRDIKDRARLPAIETPPGVIEVEGVARRHAARLYDLGNKEGLRPGAIVQNAEIDDVAKAGKLSLVPFIVEQTSNTNDGLVRNWPHPSSGIEKHRGYAFQWYGLAVTALVFFVVTGFRRGTKSAESE